MTLTAEHLARLIVESIDRHGLRGLIYEADGMTDVVMHGKVDMVAVAQDLISAMANSGSQPLS
jgi:hypothetical protein